MAGTGRYTIGAVKLGTTVIPQIISSNVDEGLQAILAGGSGGVYNTFSADGRYAPRVRFSTRAVKTALGLCGLLGTSMAVSNGVVYFQQYDSVGTRTAAGCKTFTFAKGLCLWRGISAPDGGPASAEFELVPVSADGTADTHTEAPSIAIPDDHADELWMASTPAGAGGWNIDTGIAERLFYATGKPYPTDIAIEAIAPVCNVELLTSLILGKDETLGSVSLVDASDAGGRGSSPITFTFNKVMSRVGSVSGGAGEAVHGVQIRCLYDKTNEPIAITGLT